MLKIFSRLLKRKAAPPAESAEDRKRHKADAAAIKDLRDASGRPWRCDRYWFVYPAGHLCDKVAQSWWPQVHDDCAAAERAVSDEGWQKCVDFVMGRAKANPFPEVRK